ncbi:bifunctional phosphopantothenoylcysteine decarboxylase/phosphopantothenate--cysteine ligase CoaBC [Methanopyrus sp.]
MVNVVVCVTGSVAAYRAPDVCRELTRRGHRVRVVTSEEALRFVGEDALGFAAEDVVPRLTSRAEHVELAEWADVVVVVPATLNTLAKIVHGVADAPVPLTALTSLGAGKRLVVAPAMSLHMYRSPPAREILRRLEKMGVIVVGPVIEEGKAKLASIGEIVRAVEGELSGFRILVTGGPTMEPLDNVRVITNRSSGRTACEICRELRARGAEVVFIHGPLRVDPPPTDERVEVETTREMLEKVVSRVDDADAIVMAAAPSDFRPAKRADGKLDSRREHEIRLIPTEKIVREVFPDFDGVRVAFKLDPEPVRGARRLLDEVPCELVVANPPETAGAEESEWWILDGNGDVIERVRGDKRELAKKLVDALSKLLRAPG